MVSRHEMFAVVARFNSHSRMSKVLDLLEELGVTRKDSIAESAPTIMSKFQFSGYYQMTTG